MNNSDYQQELALIHQLQTHTFSVGHAYLLILFSLPLPIHWKLAIYHFFTTLPLPQLSPMATTVLILVGPILFLVFMYFFVKLIITIVRTLIPFALTKFKKTKEEKIFLELTFPAELKEEPIICNLCKKFDIVLNIVEASFSTDTGWAILILEGTQEELDKAFNHLKDTGVIIGETQKIP